MFHGTLRTGSRLWSTLPTGYGDAPFHLAFRSSCHDCRNCGWKFRYKFIETVCCFPSELAIPVIDCTLRPWGSGSCGRAGPDLDHLLIITSPRLVTSLLGTAQPILQAFRFHIDSIPRLDDITQWKRKFLVVSIRLSEEGQEAESPDA